MILDRRNILSSPIHGKLQAQERITAGLKHCTQLKRPRNRRRGGKEPEQLHAVAKKPVDQHRGAKAAAGAGAAVCENLRDRENRLNGKAGVADKG